jgi:hypothetical protein
MSRRDLARRRTDAFESGCSFAVRYSLEGKSYDPPTFCETLAEAQRSAAEAFNRLNTATGVELHERPGDMKKVQVWIEHFANGQWTVVDEPARRGVYDTARPRG